MADATICYEISDPEAEVVFNIRTYKGELWEVVIDHTTIPGKGETLRMRVYRRSHAADIDLRIADRAVMDIGAVAKLLGKHYCDMAQHVRDAKTLLDTIESGRELDKPGIEAIEDLYKK